MTAHMTQSQPSELKSELIAPGPTETPKRARRPRRQGVLALARELAEFESFLDWAEANDYDHGYLAVLAAACRSLLRGIEDGSEASAVVSEALGAWRDAMDERERHEAREREASRAEFDRLMAEEELSRTAECPYCGAEPGLPCRTVSQRGAVLTYCHRGRYRLARSLNDGTPGGEET